MDPVEIQAEQVPLAILLIEEHPAPAMGAVDVVERRSATPRAHILIAFELSFHDVSLSKSWVSGSVSYLETLIFIA